MPQLRFSAAAILCLLLTAIPAGAHSELVDSQPAAGAELTQAPTTVRLVFTDDLAPASTVQVVDAAFGSVAAGPATIDPTEPRAMTVALQPLAPGDYTVQYHAVEAADQHAVDGSFAFRVAGTAPVATGSDVGTVAPSTPAAATPAVAATVVGTTAPPTTGALPNWVYFVTAFLAVIGMFAVTVRRRKIRIIEPEAPEENA